MNSSHFEPISIESTHARRGHGFHIFLAIVGIAIALGLYVGSASGFFTQQASMLIVLCCGLILLPLIFMDPVHGLVVYALLAPISLEFQISGIELRVHDPLAVLILLGIIIQALKSSRPLPRLRCKKVLIAYALVALGVTVFGMMFMARGRPPSIFHALKVVQYVVIAIAAGLSIRTRRDLRMVVGGFIGGLVLLAAQLGWDAGYVVGRTTGAAVNEKANVLSVYLAVASAVVLGCADRVKDKMAVVGLMALMLIASYAMLLTKSRSGYASLGVVLVVSVFVMRRKFIPLSVLSLGALAFFSKEDLFARATTIGAAVGIGEDSSFDARMIAYSLIWRQTSSQPLTLLFGEGRGVEGLAYADTQWGIEFLYGGLLGLLATIAMIGGVLWFSIQTWRKSRHYSPTLGAAATAAMLAMVAASVSTFGLTSWSSIRLAEAIFIMIGVAMAADRIMRREDNLMDSMRQNPRVPASATVPREQPQREKLKFDY
ncbi:MAG: hypothetical protein KDB07_12415 [Planctomycetes bacterium]|nr:hypothetical protein [Planctomycetota bacterium]